MIARRFTIICLIAAGCGTALAALVARGDRESRPVVIGEVVACSVEDGMRCPPRKPG